MVPFGLIAHESRVYHTTTSRKNFISNKTTIEKLGNIILYGIPFIAMKET
jgi:hypothetical protein